nr:MAG TPA: cysteine protease [Caudoviricetes sp.]
MICGSGTHPRKGEDIVCALLKNRGSKDQQGVAPYIYFQL